MSSQRESGKSLQIGIVVLLAISSAQVAWWVAENNWYSNRVAEQLIEVYANQAAVLNEVIAFVGPSDLASVPAYLEFDADTTKFRVRATALSTLQESTAKRRNRYLWEGGFFLVVLIAGMAVVVTSIRQDHALRRRQRNFVASVSHEFKSPLASIRLAADTLERRCNDAHVARWAPRIRSDCERLLGTVENLLDSARLEEGRLEMQPQVVALAGIANIVTEETGARAASEGIEITSTGLDDVKLYADPIAVESILRNLVDNAIKACVAGDGDKIEIRAEQTDDRLDLIVADNGMGFPANEAPLLFQKFYRVGDELRRRTTGTGLGLFIVHQFATLSGADVTAASEGPGNGATVTVSWTNPQPS